MTTRSSALGTPDFLLDGAGISSCMMFRRLPRSVSAANSRSPTMSSCSTTPSANRSTRPSICVPAVSCSGATYAGLPLTVPARVGCRAFAHFAIPKSSNFTAPVRVTITLAGVTSR